MKVYGKLESAQIEHLDSDPTNKPLGRVWHNKTSNKTKVRQNSSDENLATETYVGTHASSTGTHGVGTIVGTTENQTLTNKTLTSPIINSPTGMTKGDVGLSNVDNTSDATKNAAVATLTNKDIDGGTASNTSRITLPKAAKTTLDGLTRKQGTILYDTTSNKPYFDDGTNLQVIGSGSGGEVNLITDGDGSIGFANYTEGSYGAATRPSGAFTGSSGAGKFAISTTTTNPLGFGTSSFVLTKSSGASRQGRAIERVFDLPLDYRAKVLQLDISYIVNSGSFVAGSNSSDSSLIWYCAFSNDGGTTWTMSEPSSFKCLSNSTTISDRFNASVQSPSDANKMKLIAYVAESADSSWAVKCILGVKPSKYVYGTNKAYLGSQTTTGSWSTSNVTYTGQYWRDGDFLAAEVKVSVSTAPTGNLTITLPMNLQIDETKLLYNQNGLTEVGTLNIRDAGTNTYDGSVQAISGSPTVVGAYAWDDGAAGIYLANNISPTAPITFASTDSIVITYRVPIVGWGISSQMSSDAGDGRLANFVGYVTTTTALTANVTNLPLTTLKDSHGAWSGSTYVIPTAGDYDFSATLEHSSAQGYGFYVYVNGSSRARIVTLRSNDVASGATTIPDLKAGDVISFRSNSSYTTIAATAAFWTISKKAGPAAIAATETISVLYTGIPTGTLNGSFNPITYPTKVKDSHGSYSGGSFIPNVSGVYDISAQVGINATYSAGNRAFIAIFIDAVSAYMNYVQTYGSASDVPVLVSVQSIPLLAGQDVTIRAASEGTSPSFNATANRHYFSVTRSGNY